MKDDATENLNKLRLEKVTDYIFKLWDENRHITTIQGYEGRTLKIIKALKLDYCYDGMDFYMDTENVTKLTSGIEAHFDYIANSQDYLTTPELLTFMRDKFNRMPRGLFNNSRKLYDVPTESEYKNIILTEIELENIGIKPVTVYKRVSIFRKSDVNIARNNLVTLPEIDEIMQKEYGHKISCRGIKKILSNKYYKTKYNLESFRLKSITTRHIYRKDILKFVKFILDDRNVDFDEYYHIAKCAEMLGVTRDVVKRCVDLKVINANIHMNGDRKVYKIPSSEIDRWKQFKSEHTSLKEFLGEFKDEFHEGIMTERKLRLYLNSKKYFGYTAIPVINTPFDKFDTCYINNEDLDGLREATKKYLSEFKFSKLSPEEKIKYSLSFIDSKLKTTKEDIENLIIDKLDNTNGQDLFAWTESTRALGQVLEKELYLYDNEEVKELISKSTPLMRSKAAKKFLGEFLRYTKVENECSFDCDFVYQDDNITPVDVTPYTMEQMGRLAILVFNETHPSFKERVNKSIEYRGYAGIWLYLALHYVCSWRKKDMMHSLPRITLPTKDYNEYFELFKKGKVTDDMAKSIARELDDLVSVLNLQPTKTEDNTNQDLILDMPESSKRMIGMLLGLCEAHVQKYEHENPGKTTTYVPICSTYERFEAVFGNEYVDIFGKSVFNNTKANRFHLINIAEIAEEEEHGTGYIIASLARAHKFTLDEKSNTTQIYLKYFKNLTETDILLRELFDRGVCSFMPYLALKMASGEDIKKLTLSEQTDLIKKLPTPIDIEDTVKELTEVLDICNDDIKKLIQIFGEKDNIEWKEELTKFVRNLAGKGGNGKTKGTKCILRTLGKECNKIYRDECVGCGEEIYLKSAFYVLGERVRFFIDKMSNTKTNASAVKYKFIIEQVLKPIVKNFRICLKEIYKVESMSTFKSIYDGNI